MKKEIEIVYNEGQGFTQYKVQYSTLAQAVKNESLSELIYAHIYKNGLRIQ